MLSKINSNAILQNVQTNNSLAWVVAFIFATLTLLSLWQNWVTLSSSPLNSNNYHHQRQFKTSNANGRFHCLSCSIASDHLFGLYNASLQNLPETQLQLSLQGTVDNLEAPGRSYAIIASPDQPAKLYKIGQIVPGGAKIQKILKDRIILDENGTLENLRLPHLALINNN